MANTIIKIKRSSANTIPPDGSLSAAELAYSYASDRLFIGTANGSNVSEIGGAYWTNQVINAYNTANTGVSGAAAAFDKANLAAVIANTVGDAANAYSVTVGAASNNWSNTVGISGNNYSVSVGASSNAWSNTKLSNTAGVWTAGGLNISDGLYITNDITHVNSIFLNVTALPTANGQVVEGQLTWNPDDKTLDIGTGTSILQVGQEQYYRVLNQSGETIFNSNAVAYYGTVGNSGKLAVRRAIANNSYDSKYILGIATEDIPNGSEGLVTTFGRVRKIDTSMFSEGDVLYVSATIPGALQNTKPTAPNNKVQVGTVITSSHTVGTIFVAVQRGSSLADDELANFNNLTEGDVIVYDSANGRFENYPQTTLNADKVDGYDASTLLGSANNAANSANSYAFATYYAKTGGTISGDVAITGNLTISGQTTYTNTTTLLIGDNIVTLNADLPGNIPPIENAGIEVNRGSANANAALFWNETTNKWQISNNFAVVSTYVNIATNTDIEQISIGSNSYSVSIGEAANNWTNTSIASLSNYANTTFYTIANGEAGFSQANAAFAKANTVDFAVRTVNSNYTLISTDRLVMSNAANAITLTLPLASTITGYYYQVKNINTGNITILPSGSDTIDGFANLVIQFQYSTVGLISTGTNWVIF